MLSVPIETVPVFDPGIPQIIFEKQYIVGGSSVFRYFDISHDSQRFLMMKSPDATTDAASGPTQLILIQNWFDELQRLVPSP